MNDDAHLLKTYAETRSEAAFAEVVRRQVDFVFSAALRQVNGDAHLAQDVTQLVFADLARKAARVAEYRVVAGWLFTSTRFAAAKLVRSERRRQARETEAHLMNEMNGDPTEKLDWERVRPVLDATLAELGEADREVILLRFFEGRNFASVGARLRLTENAARMRVGRALDKLHARLARRGVTSTSAALAVALGGQAVAAAPAGLAASVTGAVLAGGGAAAAGAAVGAGTWAIFSTMTMTKLQLGIGGVVAAAAVTGFALQAQTNADLRDKVSALQTENAARASVQAENTAWKRTAAEVAELSGDDAELRRLGEESAGLKSRQQQLVRAEQARAAAGGGAPVFDVAKLDRMPSPTRQARPKYPAELRNAGTEGLVVVDFIVDANGVVRNAWAVRSSLTRQEARMGSETGTVATGAGGGGAKALMLSEFTVAAVGTPKADGGTGAEGARQLEAAAVEAVSQWAFKAGQKGGRSVNTHMQVPIMFTLGREVNGTAQPAPKAGP